jgi:hypothetical protein
MRATTALNRNSILLHSIVNDDKLIFLLAKNRANGTQFEKSEKEKQRSANNKGAKQKTLFRIIVENNIAICTMCAFFFLSPNMGRSSVSGL